MISPGDCDSICRKFTQFTLECKFSPPALTVVWILPHLNNINLSDFSGHTVYNQFAEGSVTVRVNSSMKYDSYTCNVIFPNGQLMASNTIEEEGIQLEHEPFYLMYEFCYFDAVL